MRLKILTLNTWQEFGPWRERWEWIFKNLPSYDADIIGFQEVFNMEFAREIQERSEYPYLTVSGRHSGLIFLSRYPVLKQDCLVMQTQSPSEDYLRYALFALFDIKGRKLAGFNTHLSWKLPEDEVRLKQTAELLSFANRHKGGFWHRLLRRVPAFMLGDFNAAPNRPSIQAVQKAWEDTYLKLNPGDPGLTWDYRNPFAERARDHMPERRIDYIFTQGLQGKAIRSEIVLNCPDAKGIYPSDHFGILTEINF